MASSTLICETQPWKTLKAHVEDVKKTHLRDLMSDSERCKSMMVEFDGLFLDYSRQCANQDTMGKLLELAEAAHLKEKINNMYSGEHINSTENRSVLHVALRAPRDAVISSDGKNVVPEVWKVLDKINEFSERIRSGSWVGATGKALKDVVAVGIGGSFLGPLFVHTALQTDPEAIASAKGRQLRFLANVDPVDVAKSITGLNPETTLVVVVSKTFTTAETMLNARTPREWISAALGPQAVAKHMVAVGTNLTLVEKFGLALIMLLHSGTGLEADIVFAVLLVYFPYLSNMVSQLLTKPVTVRGPHEMNCLPIECLQCWTANTKILSVFSSVVGNLRTQSCSGRFHMGDQFF